MKLKEARMLASFARKTRISPKKLYGQLSRGKLTEEMRGIVKRHRQRATGMYQAHAWRKGLTMAEAGKAASSRTTARAASKMIRAREKLIEGYVGHGDRGKKSKRSKRAIIRAWAEKLGSTPPEFDKWTKAYNKRRK